MPRFGRTRIKPLMWTHWADGINTVDSPHRIGKHQAAGGSINAIFSPKSTKRRPGNTALPSTFAGRIRGLWAYLNGSGTDRLLSVNGSAVYNCGKALTGSSNTNIGSISGDGEAWFANQFGSCFIANGSGVWKIEETTLYQVGISAPSGVSVAAASGGSLPDGDYVVYACYARKVDGSNVLFSKGESLGTVTLGGGNNTVAITDFDNSSDAQVGNKVIFMSDADGSTYYLYHETDNNTTTSFNITGDTNKNEAIVYSAEALDNNRPENFTQIVCQDKRLWGISGDTLYYSIQASNKYDLERFPTEYFIKFPFRLTGLFVGGPHLFVNTDDGIIKIPYSDPSVQWEHTERRWNFQYQRTLAWWHGLVIGLTNDGVRAFDWETGKFHSQELSQDIKPDIERLYDGWSVDKRPCGVIYRRDERTEYQLSFSDNDIGTNGNNVTWVLNLNRFALMDNNEVRAPWEKWNRGANYMVVDVDSGFFAAQSRSTTSVIYREIDTHSYDSNIWIADTLETQYNPDMVIYTGRQIPDLRGRVLWGPLFTFAQYTQDWTVTIRTEEYRGPIDSETMSASASSLFGVARFGVDRFSPEAPARHKGKLKRNLKGYTVYLVIEQQANDVDFEILEIQLEGMLTRSRYT